MKKAGIFLAVIALFFIINLSIVSASCVYNGNTYSSGSTAYIGGKCYKCSGSSISQVDACSNCGRDCSSTPTNPNPTCASAGGCSYNSNCYSSGTVVLLSNGLCAFAKKESMTNAVIAKL